MDATALSREQQEFSRKAVIAVIAALIMLYAAWRGLSPAGTALAGAAVSHATAPHAVDAHRHVQPPALYSVIPFAALLLSIALLPLFRKTEHWWECNWNRLLVAVFLGGVTLIYYGLLYGHGVVDHMTHEVTEAGWPAALAVLKNALLVEYIPFITLLFSLYVISGGIALEGDLVGRPRLNAGIIGLGGLLASFIGTTGAAMLLIRPLLRANRRRQYVAHTVVFFIFVACNTGGCLLPIGDPPLFLGFLRGVSFTWTLNLWPMWLFMNLSLLAVYYAWDTLRYRQEKANGGQHKGSEGDGTTPAGSPHDGAASAGRLPSNADYAHGQVPNKVAKSGPRLTVRGKWNFLWLAGVIAAVALLDPSKPIPGTGWHAPLYFRELVMLVLTALSLWSTSSEVRQQNAFNYDAILEVAALFIGIFICMQAPVQLLNVYGASLGIDTPTEFYWGTGLLSSFLDNAPTYVVFFETARAIGSDGPTVAGVGTMALTGISLGAVFMGAMTYIGNGPNFMVKAIAEKNNVRMPTFFGYMAYSCAVLLPLSLAMTLLFL